MLTLDVPNVPPQLAPVMIADRSQGQSDETKMDRTIGVCHLIENQPDSHLYAFNVMSPVTEASHYFSHFEQREVGLAGGVSILQSPEHGTLKDLGGGNYLYQPASGYLGPDRAVVLVEIGDFKVKMVYFYNVLLGVPGGSDQGDPHDSKEYCSQGKGRVWKISLNLDDPTADLIAVQAPARGVIPEVKLTDLAGNALAATSGSAITLDLTAAGHGWFIDATPQDNDEFLPTADPNIFIAKPGSAAEGKMDLLSVLLHEYGHVLGLGNSANPRDAMAAVLKPGVRHLLSVNDLALLHGLTLDPPNRWGQTPFISYSDPLFQFQPPRIAEIQGANLLITDRQISSPIENYTGGSAEEVPFAILRAIEKELLGICVASENQNYISDHKAALGVVNPGAHVLSALLNRGIAVNTPISTKIIQPPQHGSIRLVGADSFGATSVVSDVFEYTPLGEYLGDDSVSFEVTVGGKKFNLNFSVKVTRYDYDSICFPDESDVVGKKGSE